jgi:hypothetical protein
MERIRGIVSRGLTWIDHFVAPDGSFSMTERSRDQFWTGGCLVFLYALRRGGQSAVTLNDHHDWWSRFIKEDGTCSVTPNYFSNALRVGFENYSIMTMYDTLGFSYLLDAADIISADRPMDELPETAAANDETFVDEEAGYVHIRRGTSSAGVSLRRHRGGFYGGYCPAMGMFNVVIGGGRLRPFPAPCYRVEGLGVSMPIRAAGVLSHGVYDGIRAFRGRANWGLDFTSNAGVSSRDDSLMLTKTFNGLKIVKSVRLTDTSIEISYDFQIDRPLDALLVTHPILLSDGKTDTALEIRGAEVTMTLGDETYRLTCAQGYPWSHHQERYLLSTSGITSQLYITVGRGIRAGGKLECTLLLEKL